MKPTLTCIEYHKNPNQAFPVAAAQFCTIGTPNFGHPPLLHLLSVRDIKL